MKTAPTLASIRPASGRALVRVAFSGVLGNLPSKRHECPNPMLSLQANLRADAYGDQVPPGGGSA